jgi:hypothetical protein
VQQKFKSLACATIGRRVTRLCNFSAVMASVLLEELLTVITSHFLRAQITPVRRGADKWWPLVMKAQSGYIGTSRTDDVRVDRGHHHRTVFLRVRASAGVIRDRHETHRTTFLWQLATRRGDARTNSRPPACTYYFICATPWSSFL